MDYPITFRMVNRNTNPPVTGELSASAEKEKTFSVSPFLNKIVTWCEQRWRWQQYVWIIAVVAGAAVAAVEYRHMLNSSLRYGINIIDVTGFARVGDHLLSGDFAYVYADSFNQTGPLQSFADSLLLRGAQAFPDDWGLTVLAFLVSMEVLLSAGVMTVWLARKCRCEKFGWTLATCATVLLSLTETPFTVFTHGHWWQIVVLWCWFAAGKNVLKGRTVQAGLFLVLATALEPWGVFGFLIVLISPSLRRACATAAIAALGVFAVWAPFVFLWPFRFGDYAWKVQQYSLWTFMLPENENFSWGYRLVQAVLVVLLVGAIIFSVRRRALLNIEYASFVLCTIPVLIVLFRVGTDAFFESYYLTTAQVFLLPVALVTLVRWPRWGIMFAMSSYLTFLGIGGFPPYGTALGAAFLASVALVGIGKRSTSSQTVDN